MRARADTAAGGAVTETSPVTPQSVLRMRERERERERAAHARACARGKEGKREDFVLGNSERERLCIRKQCP